VLSVLADGHGNEGGNVAKMAVEIVSRYITLNAAGKDKTEYL
jgi:hypothetical protein